MSASRLIAPVVAALTLGAAPALAQVQGDNGQAPTTAAECQSKVKGVDAALKWENDRWVKLSGRKLALRAKITKKIKTAAADNAAMKTRAEEITALLAADPPPGEEQAQALQNELDFIGQDTAENEQKTDGWHYQVDDIDAELKRLRKLHVSNVRNTVKYRKQVVEYCNTHF